MSVVSLDYFKRQCRMDDIATDDEFLQKKLDAAVDHVVSLTNRSLDELLSLCDGEHLPPQLEEAVVMLGAHWVNQAEGVSGISQHVVPFGVSALVKRYVRLDGTHEAVYGV